MSEAKLNQKDLNKLKNELKDMKVQDISILFEELDSKNLVIAYRLLPKDKAVETFSHMNSDQQETLIHAITDSELSGIINHLFMDDAVDLIEEMPSNVVKRILKNVDNTNRKIINELLNYPEDSAGSIMTTEFTDLKDFMTVEEAFNRIKKIGVNKETIYTCYVLDESRKIIGIVSAKELLLANRDNLIKDIMDTNLITVNTLDDQEEVSNKIRKYDVVAMPVVDSENRLVGIITVDDIIDVIHEEAKEDFEKMAAMAPSKEDYFKTSVFKHTQNRIVWLTILMFSAIIIGSLIMQYEHAFEAVPILVAFIPMLMDTGGNCGAQTSTLVIRGLSVGEIKSADIKKLLWKELRVSALVGALFALLNGIRIMIQYNDLSLAIVIGLTLIGTIIIAKILGCILPIIAKKLKIDPAVMSAPLITTIADAMAILLYFNIAVLLLNL